MFTSFSYLGTKTLRAVVSTRAEAARHRAVEDVITAYRSSVKARPTIAWANTPPALVWQLPAPSLVELSSAPLPVEIGVG